jgi:hypothetical protein
MKAKNHNITWLQITSQTEIMPQYQSLDSRERGKLRLVVGLPQGFADSVSDLFRGRLAA